MAASWQSLTLVLCNNNNKKTTYQPVTISEKLSTIFFSIQVKRSLASRLKCLFYNCPLNYDSLFPDGALPSTCTQSLLVQSYSASCWSHYPHPYLRLQRGNPKEEIFPPSLQQFFGDVICGLNLSLPRKRESLFEGAVYTIWVSCSWLLHFSMWQSEQSHNAFSAGLKTAHRPELPLYYLKLHRWLVKFNWLVL